MCMQMWDLQQTTMNVVFASFATSSSRLEASCRVGLPGWEGGCPCTPEVSSQLAAPGTAKETEGQQGGTCPETASSVPSCDLRTTPGLALRSP